MCEVAWVHTRPRRQAKEISWRLWQCAPRPLRIFRDFWDWLFTQKTSIPITWRLRSAIGIIRHAHIELTGLINAKDLHADLSAKIIALAEGVEEAEEFLLAWCFRSNQKSSIERVSIPAKQYAYLLANAYFLCVKNIVCEKRIESDRHILLLTRAMRAARSCAKWSWIRKDDPPEDLWTNASYLYRQFELAKRLSQQPPSERTLKNMERIEQDYLAALFIQYRSSIRKEEWKVNSSVTGRV